eukprot:CAMPEP_0172482638 /NCGR_PEP_ID=MMETSP1066-20121228/9143_1 /TAXON_ID=671091 /ORGANISM="Coscinodiscus wailesii, Strain CCMP2513" /LENGTH=486 /DNA_ID=CAMNT_0013245909 /DNA_START=75 /DNA_END=1535 /DNA_ORIENTATION=+
MTFQEISSHRRQCEYEDKIEALLECINLARELIEAKDSSEISIPINKRLNELNSTWRLEQTALPGLFASIHELKSQLQAVCSDTEVVIQENRELRECLEVSEESNKRAVRALAKLSKENKRLKSKVERIRKRRSERSSMFQSVKEYLSKIQVMEKEEMDKCTERKVKMHERFLVTDDKSRVIDDEDDTVISAVSSISTSSLVTDDSLPTLRFGVNEEGHSHSSTSMSSSVSSIEEDRKGQQLHQQRNTTSSYQMLAGLLGSPSAKVYKVQVAVGCQIGLQFQKIPCHEGQAALKRCGILNDQIMDNDNNHIDARQIKHNSERSFQKEQLEEGDFVVCGFKGFDDVRYVRPTIGAKLIAINDECLESNCFSAEEMCAKIAQIVARKKPMAFKFRNDVLNQRQTQILNKGTDGMTTMEMGCKGCGFSSDFGETVRGVDEIFIDADICIDNKDVTKKSTISLKDNLRSTMRSTIKISMAGPRSGFLTFH